MQCLQPRLVRRGLGADALSQVTGSVQGSVTGSGAYQATGNLYAQANSYTGGLIQQYGTTAVNDVLSSMPPEVTQAFNMGAQIIAKGRPAIDLALTLTKKEMPSEQEIVAAMAAVAGMVNPVAGAFMAAAGEFSIAMQESMVSLFSALGMYQEPDPQWDYIGFLRANIDTVPSGPLDPNWISFRNFIDFVNFINNGKLPPATPTYVNGTLVVGYPWYRPNASASAINNVFTNLYGHTLLRLGPPSQDTWSQAHPYRCDQAPPNPLNKEYNSKGELIQHDHGVSYCVSTVAGRPQDTSDWSNGTYHYSQADFKAAMADMIANAPSPFETYFNLMLKKNLEFWANGMPFIPIRTLLAAAATAWNMIHQGDPNDCYDPTPVNDPSQTNGIPGDTFIGGPYSTVYKGTTIGYILGPLGGKLDLKSRLLSERPRLCVNSGALVPRATQSTPAVAATKTAAAVVAVPAVAAAGTLLYAYATGQAIDTVVKGAWRWLTR